MASAHVSEVENPAPWLQGGELMMTTGMNLSPRGPSATSATSPRPGRSRWDWGWARS
ncbi:hypothetical protein ACFQZC_04530 [Streptacidiphilus monticola]